MFKILERCIFEAKIIIKKSKKRNYEPMREMLFKYNTFFLTFIISLFIQQASSQNLRINEVMPSNISVIQDEDQDYSDWLELINTDNSTIQLSDYKLSDKADFASAWQLPDLELNSGEIWFLYASGKDKNFIKSYWHTLIKEGDSWKYILPESEIAQWRQIGFDDRNWETGNSGIGYGDYDDETIIAPTISLFMRKTFSIEDPAQIIEMILHMDYDDSFVAYLNGQEIARSNIGTTGDFPAYNQPALIGYEAKIYQDLKPETYSVESLQTILQPGENVLAIQVHNINETSSDFTAIPFLSVLKETMPDMEVPSTINLPQKVAHTDFKIDADGDTLYLFNSQGQITDQLIIQSFPANYSVGYKPDNFNQLFNFSESSPGTPNTTEAVIIDENLLPVFSIPGGIYTESFELNLTADASLGKVHYTTDGSEPTFESPIYESPILVNQPISIRAKVFKSAEIFGKTLTNSYYPFNDKELPIMFLSTNPENLWNEESGIYTYGDDYETNFPYHGANFWQDWEKPVHMELYNPSGEPGFSIDGGIKIHGGGSRGYEQKAFNLYARKLYGAGKIEATLFEDKANDAYESLVLRNSGNDWFGQSRPIGSMFRDVMMSKLALNMNLDAAAGRPCVVYINGDFWGIYNIRERLDENFIVDNHLLSESEFDLLQYNYSIINGSREHYRQMLYFLEDHDMSVDENFEYIKEQMDISNFIRYQSAEIFFGNWDWPGNNIKFWRTNSPLGRWRWILHDTDFGYGLYDVDDIFYKNSLTFATATDGDDWPNPPWSTFILRTLLNNQSFKNEFINTFADHLNTTLNENTTIPLINHYSSQIESEIPTHIEKWGSTYEDWLGTIDLMHEFSRLRPEIMRGYFREYFSIPQNQQIQITTSGSDDARILVNTVVIDQFPWDGIYFNQIPIELTALAPNGYQFARWEGDYSSTETKIQIPMDSDVNITAVFEPSQAGEYAGIIINEISYHANSTADGEDWVELYNNSSNYIDISEWILRDSNEDHYFRIPINTIMAPESYIVFARSLSDFPVVYPTVRNVTGQLGFGFNSAGECVRLFNEIGELQDEVCYANEYPWPTGPDGQGYTLALNSPDLDNSEGFNWNNSKYLLGTPGKANQPPTNSNIVTQSESKLLNCYPNPVSESLYIPIRSRGNEQTKIDILNLNGQIISTLYNGILPKGNQTITWNTQGLLPGFLLVRMQTANQVQIKKIVKH